jgi:hypothetical protein
VKDECKEWWKQSLGVSLAVTGVHWEICDDRDILSVHFLKKKVTLDLWWKVGDSWKNEMHKQIFIQMN